MGEEDHPFGVTKSTETNIDTEEMKQLRDRDVVAADIYGGARMIMHVLDKDGLLPRPFVWPNVRDERQAKEPTARQWFSRGTSTLDPDVPTETEMAVRVREGDIRRARTVDALYRRMSNQEFPVRAPTEHTGSAFAPLRQLEWTKAGIKAMDGVVEEKKHGEAGGAPRGARVGRDERMRNSDEERHMEELLQELHTKYTEQTLGIKHGKEFAQLETPAQTLFTRRFHAITDDAHRLQRQPRPEPGMVTIPLDPVGLEEVLAEVRLLPGAPEW
jgi:hypothetical protein